MLLVALVLPVFVVVFCVIVAGLEVGTLIVECGWCFMLDLASTWNVDVGVTC